MPEELVYFKHPLLSEQEQNSGWWLANLPAKREWSHLPEATAFIMRALISTREEAATLRAELERYKAMVENAQEQIEKIEIWTRAYPIDVFIEPAKQDWKDANEILKKHGISFTALNGATMRHVINGVEGYAKAALASLDSGKGDK